MDEEGGGDEGLQRDSVRRGDAARGHSPLLLSVMCKHLRKRVRVCAHSFFFLFFLFSQQGRVGVRLYRWEKG